MKHRTSVFWGVLCVLFLTSELSHLAESLARDSTRARPAESLARDAGPARETGDGPVVVNEVVARPSEGEDWIELLNTSTGPADLSGWSIRDASDGQPNPDHVFTFPEGSVLEPGHYLVLERGAESSFDFGLGSEDGVFLYDEVGLLIDATVWEDGQAEEGSSWGRFPDGTGPFQTLGTPTRGQANRSDIEPTPPPSDYIYDGQVRTYDLEVDEEDWEWLQHNQTLEVYVPGKVLFEGETYGPAGVRYKGSTGALYSCVDDQGNQLCDKLSMKVSFNENDDEGRFYGLKKV